MASASLRARMIACGLAAAFFRVAMAADAAPPAPDDLSNQACLSCHAVAKGSKPVDAAAYARGAHGRMGCVACHAEIADSRAEHRKVGGAAKPDCAACHLKLWNAVAAGPRVAGREGLELVARNVEAYRRSFHARPDKDDPSRAKAVCSDCHATHDFTVPPRGTAEREQWRRSIPRTCGEKCHEDQLESYAGSAHGKAALDAKDARAPVCIDCHTSHDITSASADSFKLKNVLACGGCHKEELQSYKDTYHGQVNRLGFTYTAKCADCHGSHGILKVNDPESKVHPNNKLKTCRQCHNDKKPGMHEAAAGFVSFGPHANSHDFARYPQTYVAAKFMVGLLIFVFAFFWAHSGLWYYREWQDRKAAKAAPRVRTEGMAEGRHFRRFSFGWRVGHLLFALITMTLVLTGTTALYSGSAWAPLVAQALGGPRVVGLIHRISAAAFVGIFVIHFVYVMQKLLRSRDFRWFGSDSLIPNWKDFRDCWGMFKWFLGRGPKPLFDRWTYFEKFDYWAVFWGVNIIGWSGLMLAFPHVTANYLPGWVFNVGTLVHGEEAFLAAVFLFTVHFFNNHFRPDKLPPPDVVMFTGTQSLEEFRRDHGAQYQRLVESGELDTWLVQAPSRPMTLGSKVLGLALIGVGLILLVLVAVGFFSAS